ncbi:hypothetical protein OG874_13005 [Nocardia sp. NBC_00565]|uniref:hypothetical protein n=1 Tax=Nocardia sp. NBC_00565 TaxID=2975993 RepID=UPI002E8204D1|nr:hypothetical protein [Nocardia sp. NBC_00565]WUC05993.1 hypothetical protein OG874_13005 [Nocardia sp. NBC_00565]
MRARSNHLLGLTLAAVFGSLVLAAGPVAVAQPPPSGPTQDCQIGESQDQGPYECVCGENNQWVCHERGHGPR